MNSKLSLENKIVYCTLYVYTVGCNSIYTYTCNSVWKVMLNKIFKKKFKL